MSDKHGDGQDTTLPVIGSSILAIAWLAYSVYFLFHFITEAVL